MGITVEVELEVELVEGGVAVSLVGVPGGTVERRSLEELGLALVGSLRGLGGAIDGRGVEALNRQAQALEALAHSLRCTARQAQPRRQVVVQGGRQCGKSLRLR
ncbi:hypothetical protein [Jannaschia sp. W003]|uniref:hypothetical protein n=1 Tax=Jannaschia sp. W003 TaxID=2867012 RepID=UPI0021A3C806|nr:hypothetical protein [Jannaschia sp. W003]UWQ22400.1 hypothetical protein K3554_05040 [Jannaschia sp. W003]